MEASMDGWARWLVVVVVLIAIVALVAFARGGTERGNPAPSPAAAIIEAVA
jgi:hypothetical protein